MAISYLGIGSNIGNRRRNIKAAIEKINSLRNTKVLKASSFIETDPIGGVLNQGKFLNAAIKIYTRFPPLILLKRLKNIEKCLGRKRGVRFGPRIIDLDILLYAGKIINKRNLSIPHARMFEREFVIKPLLQVL